MKEWYKDFIGVYENAFPNDWCNNVIDLINNSSLRPRPLNEGGDLNKKDLCYFFNLKDNISQEFITNFFKKYWVLYAAQNPYLNSYERHSILYVKGQKTKPTEGYHIWHCEHGNYEISNRIAAYTLYLNDVQEGGETEFLYQSLRIPPKQGSLCIFPSNYTHLHRGNPPLTNDKYVLTGWVEILPPEN